MDFSFLQWAVVPSLIYKYWGSTIPSNWNMPLEKWELVRMLRNSPSLSVTAECRKTSSACPERVLTNKKSLFQKLHTEMRQTVWLQLQELSLRGVKRMFPRTLYQLSGKVVEVAWFRPLQLPVIIASMVVIIKEN